MLVFEEDTALVLAFLDEAVLLQLTSLEIVDSIIADLESFLTSAVCLGDTRFVLGSRLTAYDAVTTAVQEVHALAVDDTAVGIIDGHLITVRALLRLHVEHV